MKAIRRRPERVKPTGPERSAYVGTDLPILLNVAPLAATRRHPNPHSVDQRKDLLESTLGSLVGWDSLRVPFTSSSRMIQRLGSLSRLPYPHRKPVLFPLLVSESDPARFPELAISR
jgi:hypothetical protein